MCNMRTNEAINIIQTASGAYFYLSNEEIEKVADDLFSKLEHVGTTGKNIACFFDLGSSKLLPLLLYKTFISLENTVMRFDVNNLKRQMELMKRLDIDIIVSYEHIKYYLENNSVFDKAVKWVTIRNENSENIFQENKDDVLVSLIEKNDMPMYLLDIGNRKIKVPGFKIAFKDETEKSYIVESEILKGFKIHKFNLPFDFKLCTDDTIELVGNKQQEKDLKSRIREIINENQRVSIGNDNEIILNSLGLVELIVKLEQEFSFRVSIEDISRNDFLTLDTIENFILKRINMRS